MIRLDFLVQAEPIYLHGLLWRRHRCEMLLIWFTNKQYTYMFQHTARTNSQNALLLFCHPGCGFVVVSLCFETGFERPERVWRISESPFKPHVVVVWIQFTKFWFPVLICFPDYQNSIWKQSGHAKKQIWLFPSYNTSEKSRTLERWNTLIRPGK